MPNLTKFTLEQPQGRGGAAIPETAQIRTATSVQEHCVSQTRSLNRGLRISEVKSESAIHGLAHAPKSAVVIFWNVARSP